VAKHVRIDEMLADPSRYFDSPMAILQDTGLTRAQQRRLLENGEYSLRQLQVASAENMPGQSAAGDADPAAQLTEVMEALNVLANSA